LWSIPGAQHTALTAWISTPNLQEKMAAVLDAKTAGLMQYMKRPPMALLASASTFDCLGLDAGACQAPSKQTLAKRRLQLMSKQDKKAAEDWDRGCKHRVLFDALALDSTSLKRAPIKDLGSKQKLPFKLPASHKTSSNNKAVSASLSTGSTSEGSTEF